MTEYQRHGGTWWRHDLHAEAYPEKVRIADIEAAAAAGDEHHELADGERFVAEVNPAVAKGDLALPGMSFPAPRPTVTGEAREVQVATTFGVPASARQEFAVASDSAVREVLERSDRVLPLGGGSNVLFTAPWEGDVMRLAIAGWEVLADDGDVVDVVVGAGEVWHDFVMVAVEQGWGGVENLALIPGSVGASPMQNIGAYGVEIRDRFLWLEAISREDGRLKRFHASACAFGYRESVFKTTERDKWIIVRVAFRLQRSAPVRLDYGAITETLAALGKQAPFGFKDVAQAVMHIRRTKLPDPAELGNAGSFFKNPVVSAETHARLKAEHPDVAAYPLEDGTVKLAAGWLIDRAGWKGHRRGTHGVHDRQALVLVNLGGATGSEILQLASDIQADVRQRFGVDLEREVNAVPEGAGHDQKAGQGM